MTRLGFAAPDRGQPVVLEAAPGTAAVIDHLRAVIAGWPGAPAGPPDRPAAGRISVAAEGLWLLESDTLEDGEARFDNALAAANAVAGVLIGGLLAARPDWLCLHAAALDLPGGAGTIVLPGAHKAGKSLFAASAAARGSTVLADDRAVLQPAPGGGATVIAMGVQPKLRLPLPAALPPDIAGFVAARLGAAEGGMRFLALSAGRDAGALLPFGARLPLGALCFLDREPDGHDPACLPLRPAEAIARLIPYIYAPGLDAAGRVAAAQRLVGTGPALMLRYRQCWDALALLPGSVQAAATP
ncbi:MAG: hypothetical protein RIB84_05320 [Sneathiellaceae bacterium]